MPKIRFTKMVASGNDFVVVENNNLPVKNRQLPFLARQVCSRKYGVGADGLLILDRSKIARKKMLIFNPDGSQPYMCGNGARCAAFYIAGKQKKTTIETKAGIIQSQVSSDQVKIKLTDPRQIKLNLKIKINRRTLKVNSIDTGVPHAVVFVYGLDNIDVYGLGNLIRKHRFFSPKGANVNFVEVLSDNSIRVRTYERGVEDETLACGTGSVASAVITAARNPQAQISKISVITKSTEILNVYFEKRGNNFKNVWLEGKARVVYKGEYYV